MSCYFKLSSNLCISDREARTTKLKEYGKKKKKLAAAQYNNPEEKKLVKSAILLFTFNFLLAFKNISCVQINATSK